jgi:hypothetical protein
LSSPALSLGYILASICALLFSAAIAGGASSRLIPTTNRLIYTGSFFLSTNAFYVMWVLTGAVAGGTLGYSIPQLWVGPEPSLLAYGAMGAGTLCFAAVGAMSAVVMHLLFIVIFLGCIIYAVALSMYTGATMGGESARSWIPKPVLVSIDKERSPKSASAKSPCEQACIDVPPADRSSSTVASVSPLFGDLGSRMRSWLPSAQTTPETMQALAGKWRVVDATGSRESYRFTAGAMLVDDGANNITKVPVRYEGNGSLITLRMEEPNKTGVIKVVSDDKLEIIAFNGKKLALRK